METALPPIWYASKRVLRTIVQALVVLVPVVNGVGIAVVSYLREQTDIVIPGTVFVVLNAVVAVTALLMGLAAKIMAVAGVNDLLGRIGLGSVPQSQIVGRDHVNGTVIVAADPKAPTTRAAYRASRRG
ncbi:hypothetical protein J2X55_002245 [Microbacterium sp. 1154]|uniref:hypothetical protein n=1 Tax=Microbacterium sp. 1154 TaxID=2817733 RepID=UPI0028603575|nr:hypothetical protein [Microbacterium sp. 1154]MDR6691333.1 hypothetical protein [Microbacterium sp. 1154]